MQRTNIEKIASNIAGEHETRDPFAICKSLDITVFFCHLVDIRGLCHCENGRKLIYIADDLDDHVAEFVCGHELGHHILHDGCNRIFMDSNTRVVVGKYENEADRFACHLLYDEPPLYSDRILTDCQMAECLNVPVNNVAARLIALGMYQ